jgi:hypothetical protein
MNWFAVLFLTSTHDCCYGGCSGCSGCGCGCAGAINTALAIDCPEPKPNLAVLACGIVNRCLNRKNILS